MITISKIVVSQFSIMNIFIGSYNIGVFCRNPTSIIHPSFTVTYTLSTEGGIRHKSMNSSINVPGKNHVEQYSIRIIHQPNKLPNENLENNTVRSRIVYIQIVANRFSIPDDIP